VNDPSGFLRDVTGDSRARSNMNHRLRGSAEDIYAYLAQFAE
jgi:cytochrome c